jgi:hypothetical protein
LFEEAPRTAATFCSSRRRAMRLSSKIARLFPRPCPASSAETPAAAASEALKGVADQNDSGDCGAAARPLMSPWGNCCAQRRATQGDGRPTRLVDRRAMARFLH